jgi:hypothetical protein
VRAEGRRIRPADYTQGGELEMLFFRLTFAALVLGGLAIWLGSELLRAVRTGTANAGGTEISRRKRPRTYWLTLAVQAGIGIGLAATLLAIVSEALVRSV